MNRLIRRTFVSKGSPTSTYRDIDKETGFRRLQQARFEIAPPVPTEIEQITQPVEKSPGCLGASDRTTPVLGGTLFPTFETHHTETTRPINPPGAKGIGEAATIGATPTTANAVVDPLSAFGIAHVDIPFTAEKVWRAISVAKSGTTQAAD